VIKDRQGLTAQKEFEVTKDIQVNQARGVTMEGWVHRDNGVSLDNEDAKVNQDHKV